MNCPYRSCAQGRPVPCSGPATREGGGGGQSFAAVPDAGGTRQARYGASPPTGPYPLGMLWQHTWLATARHLLKPDGRVQVVSPSQGQVQGEELARETIARMKIAFVDHLPRIGNKRGSRTIGKPVQCKSGEII